jgi:LemA protein
MNTEIIILIVVLSISYIWYASIVAKKNKVKESLSGIDVQLKKRSNLIPNILKIAKKFMEHEKELITKVTQLRSKADADYDLGDAESVKSHLKNVGALDQGLGQLMISVEAYPDLKSDKSMLQAQRTYSEVEEHIAAARRFYNASVTSLNNSIEIFPGNILANFAKAKAMPFYKTDELSKSPIDASQFL